MRRGIPRGPFFIGRVRKINESDSGYFELGSDLDLGVASLQGQVL
jgi:hypothetical protein